ncbi:MAG: NAD-binding protein [Anaerolineae bacterium]|nr:NAD-binding protein [Anaerolineae bacterium]
MLLQLVQKFLRVRQRYSRSEVVRIAGALVGLALTGMVAYSLLEGWSPLDALYATIITITTVGYGDFTPHSPEGRIFAIVFTLVAIAFGGYSISTLAAYTIERRTRDLSLRFRKRLMNRIRNFNGHYILCGADLLGRRIAEDFYQGKINFVLIDDNEALIKSALLYAYPEYFQHKIKTLLDFHEVDLSEFESLTLEQLSEQLNIPYLVADPADDSALIQAGIERAAGLIAVRPDDRDNLSIVIGARSLAKRGGNESLRIMTRANDPNIMRKMYLAGADYVRIPTIMSGMEMASHMLHPEIGNWWYSRIGDGDNARPMFQQISASDRAGWVGRSVTQIHETDRILIVSVKRDGQFMSPPAFDTVLQAGDVVIVIQ